MDFFTEPLIGKRLNPFFGIALRPQNLTYISLLAAIFIHLRINLSFKIEAFLLAIYFLITIVKKLFLLNFTVHSKLIIQLLQFVTFVQNLFGSNLFFWIDQDVFNFYRGDVKFDWVRKFCRRMSFGSITFILYVIQISVLKYNLRFFALTLMTILLEIWYITNKFVFGRILYGLHVIKELAIFVIILETWLISSINILWFIFAWYILVDLWLDSIILLFLLQVNFPI